MRFPLQPLVDAALAGRRLHTRSCELCVDPGQGPCVTKADLERRFGLKPATFGHYLRNGLPVWLADVAATGIGLHPAEVWPDFVNVYQRCAGCPEVFVATHGRQRFCSPACRDRVWRAGASEYRARQLEARRRYYEECGEYERARQRAYHAANRDRINAAKRERRRVA